MNDGRYQQWPSGYLITFSCYGRVVHGESRRAVDRQHNKPGERYPAEHPGLALAERRSMAEVPYRLSPLARQSVVTAVKEVCAHRGWTLHAVNALSDHVHVVVEAEAKPERVMGDFKAYASRKLARNVDPQKRRWARHGSTVWLNSGKSVDQAMRYVIVGQSSRWACYWLGQS